MIVLRYQASMKRPTIVLLLKIVEINHVGMD